MNHSDAGSHVVPGEAESRPREWVAESNRYTEDHHYRNPTRGFVAIHDEPLSLVEVADRLCDLLREMRRLNEHFRSCFGMPPDDTKYRIRNIMTGEIIASEMVEVFATCHLPIDKPIVRKWFSESSKASGHASTHGRRRRKI